MTTVVLRAVLALGLVAACSSTPEPTQTVQSNLAFSGGNNRGYCGSNPSPECAQGTPLGAKQLVLTFDDGPGTRTGELSSWLAARGIHATFFHLGEYASGNGSLMAQVESNGHLIGNHTYDHQDLTTLSGQQVVDEVTSTDSIISPWVDQGHFVFRAPYGNWSSADYTALEGTPMKKYAGPVRWDIGGQMTATYAADWDCWQNQNGYGVMTTKQCGDRYLAQIHDVDHGIVLMHDQDYGDSSNHSLTSGQGNTVDMVKYIVPILEQQGYTFIRVDQVPDVAAALSGNPPDAGGGGDAGACGGFNPTWTQGNANTWWIEYAISGSVASASLEVVGGQTTQLSSMYGKWVGGPNQQIPSGTKVVVHATSTTSQNAQTQPFGYLVTTSPTTACGAVTDAGTDSGGTDASADSGKTDAGNTDAGATDSGATCTLNPTWTQGNANTWWVEYAISGSIASAYLEVQGGQIVQLTNQWGKWVGGPSAAIPSGTTVIVHAKDTQGHTAQTVPFGYLVVKSPKTSGC